MKLINLITRGIGWKLATTFFFISILSLASISTNAPFLSLLIVILLMAYISLKNLEMLKGTNNGLFYCLMILFKVVIVIYQATYKNLPMGGIDWGNYHRSAVYLINNSNSYIELISTNGRDLFSKIVATIYTIFGVNPEQIYFYILLVSIIMFRFTYLTVLVLTKDCKKSSFISFLVALLPIEFIYSVTFLREIPIQCLFTISLYYFVVYLTENNGKALLKSLFYASLMCMMHAGMIGIFATYLFVYVNRNKNGLSFFNPFKLLVFGLLGVAILLSPIGNSMLLKFQGIENSEDLLRKKQYVAGNTSYITQTPQSIVDIPLQTPYRMFMFAFSPLPWQVYNLPTLLAWLLDGLLRLFIMYRLLKYFLIARKYEKRPLNKILNSSFLLIILSTYFIFSWGTQNYGTAMRHRAKILPLEAIVVFISYNELMDIRRRRNEDECIE